MDESARRKWDRIYADSGSNIPAAAEVLLENQHLLPASGKALDLACGRGGNALLLARTGLNTSAWDISGLALEQLSGLAKTNGLTISTLARDVVEQPPEPEMFDVIVVTRFLDRKLFSALIKALTPGGVVFYQTFTREKAKTGGPSNPDYLLKENELLAVFSELRVLSFRDEGTQGRTDEGLRNESWIVAKKRVS